MSRGPLFRDTYSPQFSGHETFPLRYGWLKKAYDRVAATQSEEENRTACWGDDAIARFGVGKNMVSSIRHWAKVTGIIEEDLKKRSVKTKKLGDIIFGPNGFDPFMEHPATSWLIHWHLAGHPRKTTWFWGFNYYSSLTFDRDIFIKKLDRFVKERNWAHIANATLRNDVACFIRTYVARRPSSKAENDDTLESPLTELGLIKAIGKKDGFRFGRGSKPSLGDGVFMYALLDFWSRYTKATTLSFETIVYAPGSPGRVFALEENDVAERLEALDRLSNGNLRWSETAGLKQVVRKAEISEDTIMSYLPMDFRKKAKTEVV